MHSNSLFQNKLPFAPNPRHFPNALNTSMEGGDPREMVERPPLKPLEEVTCFKVFVAQDLLYFAVAAFYFLISYCLKPFLERIRSLNCSVAFYNV